jgi:hypothetical protein
MLDEKVFINPVPERDYSFFLFSCLAAPLGPVGCLQGDGLYLSQKINNGKESYLSCALRKFDDWIID